MSRLMKILTLLLSVVNLFSIVDYSKINTFNIHDQTLFVSTEYINSNNKVIKITDTYFKIYQINDEGALIHKFNIESTMPAYASINGNYMIISEINSAFDFENPYKHTLYDISDIDNPQAVHTQYSTKRESLICGTFYIIAGVGSLDVFSLNDYSFIERYDDYKPYDNIEEIGKFRLWKHSDESIHICHFDENGSIVFDKDLEQCYGNICVSGDSLLNCCSDFIYIYNLADSLNHVETLYFPNSKSLNFKPYFNGQRLGLIKDNPNPSFNDKLAIYDLDDTGEFNLVSEYDLIADSQYAWGMNSYDSMQHNQYYYFGFVMYGYYKFNMEDLANEPELIEHQELPLSISINDNIMNYNYFRNFGYNKQYDISNINDITRIANADSLGERLYFGDDSERMILKDWRDGTIKLYSLDNSQYNLVTTLTIEDNPFFFNFVNVLKWDGVDLIYSQAENLFWKRYNNGSFEEIDSYTENTLDYSCHWFFNENYLYKLYENGMLESYSIENNHFELLSSVRWAGHSSSIRKYGLECGLLYATKYDGSHKIYDLNEDPIDFSVALELNSSLLNGGVQKYGDYYIYPGSDNENYVNFWGFESLKYINIYNPTETLKFSLLSLNVQTTLILLILKRLFPIILIKPQM